ncbi:histidine kinase dimerization/phospho-acceptor domain-containing protein, partial [Staphylococcus epidermidis]|uniref:histidine kinase dimerization/phospho-acceptor domain-containing protein n=1 Tax=Staphylococcus epidermidis TaxID=1282 RepID=UPI0037D9FD54
MTDPILPTHPRPPLPIPNHIPLKILPLPKQHLIPYYILPLLNLQNQFSLHQIQQNTHSFFLHINQQQPIIPPLNFTTILQQTGFLTPYIPLLHHLTQQQQLQPQPPQFLPNLSHQLPTPLTSINTYIQPLQEPPSQHKHLPPSFLSLTPEHTEPIIRLVNHLLQLSK